MKKIISLEELSMFLFSIFLFSKLSFSWYWFPVFILVPDISMLGYLFGNSVGAFCYNLVHHKAVALFIYVIGCFLHNELLQFAGIILFGHSSMDRFFGYGLKKQEGFKFTHLGEIGK